MWELPHQLYVLWLAALLDVVLGDPPSRWHPVAWMGTVIGAFRRRAPTQGRAVPFLAGALFMLVGIGFCAGGGLFVEGLLWSGLGKSPIGTATQGQVPRMNSGREEGRNPGELHFAAWSPDHDTAPTAGLPHDCVAGAPTGRDSKAQGASALGFEPNELCAAPTGRDSPICLRGPSVGVSPLQGFNKFLWTATQGDALGYRISPRWGLHPVVAWSPDHRYLHNYPLGHRSGAARLA